jgi:hypothetical protein
VHGTGRKQGVSACAAASGKAAICGGVQAVGRSAQKERHLDPDAAQDHPARAQSAFRGCDDFPALLLIILDEQTCKTAGA